MNIFSRFFGWLTKSVRAVFASPITGQVDDSPGYQRLNASRHDRDFAEQQKLYLDALEAWRKNPYAKRIIAIITDFVLGDELLISSKNRHLKRFISAFWNHPENHMDLRLEQMSDELSRAGDLFPVLVMEDATGISWIRFVPKDYISQIITAEGDWEAELAYIEPRTDRDKIWYSPKNPVTKLSRKLECPHCGTPYPVPLLEHCEKCGAPTVVYTELEGERAVMLHYKVNPVLGALTGEGDLNAAIPWLQRYSRMLEDRIRLHWATRSFLWFVTVPSKMVKAKQEQYNQPPEAGSVIVKDSGEEWDMKAPNLQARDAGADLLAVRQMVRANDGFPPHWSGEAGSSTLAEARAMQAAPERHLKRRQAYFVWLLEDILYQAYQRGVQTGLWPPLPTRDYKKLFTVHLPDISREDNNNLALASKDLSAALTSASAYLPKKSRTFAGHLLQLVYKFAGENLTDEEKDKILHESWTDSPSTNSGTATNPVPVVTPAGPARNGQH